MLTNFWSKVMPILDGAPDQSMLQDVIVTTLKVPHDELPNSWIDAEQKVRRNEPFPLAPLSTPSVNSSLVCPNRSARMSPIIAFA